MIIGVGVDIIEIERIKNAIERNTSFIKKVFVENEIEYFKSRNFKPEFVAGRFAAKEAISKALGTGFREFNFGDIEIDRTVLGKPIVILKGKAKKIAEKSCGASFKLHVSISHSKRDAVAYAVLETIDNEQRTKNN